ncbi:hypothetical protein [Streptosporangium sp. KLBMP 9127]|nr:hypothetical protein [Streptosporangium sp. KLBMP 9127]
MPCGERLQLLGRGLALAGELAVPALEAFAEVAVDLLVAARLVLLDLGEEVVLPFGQIGDFGFVPIDSGVLGGHRLERGP